MLWAYATSQMLECMKDKSVVACLWILGENKDQILMHMSHFQDFEDWTK